MPAPQPPLADVPLGRRVVVRHRIEDGARASDVLGELLAQDAASITVRTRSGPVRVALSDVIAAKQVPHTRWRVEAFLDRVPVAVLDLDGVLRTHDTSGGVAAAERDLGLEPGGLLTLAAGLPEAGEMIHGRARYADWSAAVTTRLLADGHGEELVSSAVTAWTSDHGIPIPATLEIVDRRLTQDRPTFVFTNGSDRVAEELDSIGLSHLLHHLLNSAELGVPKPDPGAYAAAHAAIEARLRRVVGRGEVGFTDGRPANVDAARRFGWQGKIFTLP